MMRLKNTAGFSFVELMTVIAIIGIMSAIALPYLISGQPQRRLKAAARDMYSAMQQARLLAVKNNQDVAVRFGADFYYIDEDNDGVHDSGESRIDLLPQYHDVEFGNGTASMSQAELDSIGANSAVNASFITFIPAGTAEFAPDPMTGDNTVYFQNTNNPSERFAVSVQMSGSVKTSWYDGNEWK